MRPVNGNQTPLPSSQSTPSTSPRWCRRRCSILIANATPLGRFHVTARPSRSRHRRARVVRRNAEIIDTTSDTVTSQFVEEDINRPTGKLTDCQARFCRRPTAGLKLLGFAIRERRGGCHVRSAHGNTFRIVVGLIRFSARFRCDDRSSSSVLLSVNQRTGVGPVRNRVLSGFAQDPRPLRSRVVQQMLLNCSGPVSK